MKVCIIIVVCIAYIGFMSLVIFKYKNIKYQNQVAVKNVNNISRQEMIYQIDKQNRTAAIRNFQDYICCRYTKIPREMAVIISDITYKLCKKHQMCFELIVGLMEVESMFNPLATSSHDSRGLLQVTYRIWAETLKLKSNESLYNIKEGIEAGILVLKYYLKKKEGNVSDALKSYNGAKNYKFSNKVLAASGRFTIFCYNNSVVKKVVKEEQ